MTDIEIQAEENPNEEAVVAEEKEKMLPSSVVSKIVERERQKAEAKAYERGKREAMEHQQLNQGNPAEAPSAPAAVGGQVTMGGMAHLSPDEIRKMIAEEAPNALMQHVNELKARQTVDAFVNKMQAAESKYPGLQDKLNELDYSTMSPIVEMANNMENTADIMKELVENPMKMGNLLTLMYSQPKLAQKAMQDLSSSIKKNQDAIAAETQARDPMSSLKPSINAGMDSGAKSVSDYRAIFRNKRR